MKKYKYLVFDFDGTLADTHRGIVDTFQETFRRMDLDVPTEKEITATIGLSLRDGLLGARGNLLLEKADAAVKLYRQLFPVIAYPLIVAFPGVVSTLEELRKRGYRMSVATSRSHVSLEAIARQIGVLDFFDGLYGAEDVVNHKPAPDLVNLILDIYALKREDVLVIGDADYDLLMGKSAGCDVCGVCWGNQSKEQLAEKKPDYLLDSLPEILNIL